MLLLWWHGKQLSFAVDLEAWPGVPALGHQGRLSPGGGHFCSVAFVYSSGGTCCKNCPQRLYWSKHLLRPRPVPYGGEEISSWLKYLGIQVGAVTSRASKDPSFPRKAPEGHVVAGSEWSLGKSAGRNHGSSTLSLSFFSVSLMRMMVRP